MYMDSIALSIRAHQSQAPFSTMEAVEMSFHQDVMLLSKRLIVTSHKLPACLTLHTPHCRYLLLGTPGGSEARPAIGCLLRLSISPNAALLGLRLP